MPKTLTDSITYTSPVTAPLGGEDRNAASVETSIQQLANRTAYLKDYVEPSAPATRLAVYPFQIVGVPSFDSSGIASWNRQTRDDRIRSRSASAPFYVPLGFLPTGAVLTKVEALVQPGAARTSTNRMGIAIHANDGTLDWTTPSAGSTVITAAALDDTTANLQVITLDLSGSPITISRGPDQPSPWLVLFAGNTFGDDAYYFRATFTDTDLKNY